VTEFRPVQVSSPLAPDVLMFRRMTGREALGRAYCYEVELLSKHDHIELNDVLGKPMAVRLEVAKDSFRYFSGLVSHFSHAGGHGRHALYRATIRPWLWFLTRTTDCRIFQNAKVPDIIKEMFREHGFSDFEDALRGDYREWQYLVQYRETNFNFLTRIMEMEGIYFFFRHEEGASKLVMADGYTAHRPFPGYAEIPYFPPDHHALRERDYIDTVAVCHHVQPGAVVLHNFDFERPKADLLTKLAAPKDHECAEHEVFDYPGQYVESDHGESCARTRLEAMHALHAQVEGQGSAQGIAPGSLFRLTGYPRDQENREYLVVSAEYALANPAYESGGAGKGPLFRCSFTAIDSQTAYRAPATTPKPFVRGPQTAVVVGPKGEEIWTDKYGRVKVQFHWDRRGKADEKSSCWVRVSQLWAGSKWGGIHLPRIGQEVIVDFLEGDPDQPIITGRVYNASHMPPYALPANATQSGIRTHSSKGAGPDNCNEIRFEDKKGAELLYIQAEKDQETLVKHKQKISVNDSLTETYKGGRETTVEKFDDTTVKGGNKNITVDKEYNLKGQRLNLKASGDIFIQVGGGTVHIDQAGNVTVKGTTINLNSGA
jgi:type VI secretion system secreted protein VgrG